MSVIFIDKKKPGFSLVCPEDIIISRAQRDVVLVHELIQPIGTQHLDDGLTYILESFTLQLVIFRSQIMRMLPERSERVDPHH
jgi:hypothetical protein